VGPDGVITVPVAGPTKVGLLTREEAASRVRQGLERFYVDPNVQFGVEQYMSNRITVLGRVQNPGMLSFDHPPTLLETLAKAGSLPVIDKQATLTRCAIFRGRDKVIWVDLKRLLNGGQVHLNLRMRPGDLVYIPDSADTMVYVLGSVHRPGAYRLTPDMSVMDALATAGGPNEDAQPREIGIYRPARQAVERIALQNLMDARQRVNFALEEGDVIFVPKSGIAEFGYVSRQLAAGLSLLTVGTILGR
jgi:polysaccharide export outer membrane protein